MSTVYSVLIVDDDADDREIIRDAFQANYNSTDFIFIENGEKLMEYLENCETLPALIMLDLNMPGKDGREALKELKMHSDFRQIPTIVFTTSSSNKDRQMSYDLGANCFITKPDTFNKLVEITRSIGKLWLSSN
ncbi:response regulator [Chitinophagaceae bacterium LB-8]|jgi:CheY-like chemotaxis protein|uniref:Response regulator n=1 Tax=Paraflavisolibacter caeni TaxID=2982496 RepID=A0A9X3BI12_9BACT|nr:response regulator [Paraflavisolibacter caeni]MCU7550537.1 response regulator [Paraflavisolibacter caeni]